MNVIQRYALHHFIVFYKNFVKLCKAGDLCENQRFRKATYANVAPFLTADRGWGLRALSTITPVSVLYYY
jgi:hypothetical protein